MYQNQSRNIYGKQDSMMGSYLGPSFSQEEIEQRLTAANAKYEVMDNPTLFKFCANEIATGKAIGWFQGRMEFGPRALGGRSILGDPRSPVMQKLLNLKVKFRESFRPFAPSVLSEDVSDWFELNVDSPYMLMVADIAKDKRLEVIAEEQLLFGIDKLNVARSQIPAVTHVDYSSRIQTVHKEYNPLYHGLISSFKELTGCPVLINTSFNVRGEPIVCTPEDAFRCFMGTEIEVLVVGNCLLRKEQQDSTLRQNYQDLFELD
jgi:carbamoyltransferase